MHDHETNGHAEAVAKTRNRVRPKIGVKPDAEKMKLTMYVDPELGRKFIVHATYTGVDRSTLFAEMIKKHCGRYVVSDRGEKAHD